MLGGPIGTNSTMADWAAIDLISINEFQLTAKYKMSAPFTLGALEIVLMGSTLGEPFGRWRMQWSKSLTQFRF